MSLITNLEVFRFRNLSHISLELNEKTNLFIGPNGHGKTNCLEALAQACSLRSLQALANKDLIQDRSAHAYIRAKAFSHSDLDIAIEIFNKGKKASINQKPLKSRTKLAEHFLLVSFIPAELNMITGSPSLRRLALDQATCALFIEHIDDLKAYEKILINRNHILKNHYPIDREALQVFSTMLIEKSAEIMSKRLKTIEALKPFFKTNLLRILGENTNAELNYQISNTYEQVAKEELIRKQTLFGAHLDNLSFELNDLDAQKCCSRGECRALVLAFKLAHMQAISTIKKTAPLVILDDIVSELDEQRKINLIEIVHELSSQSFFSATSLAAFGHSFQKSSSFNIYHGTLR